MKKRVLDSWKRPIEIEVTEDLSERYPQQTELQLNKLDEATAEEWDEWQEKELDWWSNRQFRFILIAVLVQFGALAFMFSTFFIISLGLGK